MSYGRAGQAETPLLPLQPVSDIPVHEIPGEAVALLDLAFELVALAGNFVEVLVCRMTPIIFDPAFRMRPVSFYDIPNPLRTPYGSEPGNV
jgi:hypothetical protein